MPWLVFTAFGVLFGFALSRGRVTDYDTVAGMFRLTDLHLFGVIGSAIATVALGQVGEGKVMAIITVAGILAGTYVYGLVRSKGETTMKKATAIAGMVALTLVFATPVLAQHGGPAGGHAATPPQGPAQMDKSMCAAMMAGMQQGGAQQGGMQPGAMQGAGPGAAMMGPGMMMGMMASMDPATMQMRGEIMKAVGEIMMKYGKATEKPAH